MNFFSHYIIVFVLVFPSLRFLFHKPTVKNVRELKQRDDDGYENVT